MLSEFSSCESSQGVAPDGTVSRANRCRLGWGFSAIAVQTICRDIIKRTKTFCLANITYRFPGMTCLSNASIIKRCPHTSWAMLEGQNSLMWSFNSEHLHWLLRVAGADLMTHVSCNFRYDIIFIAVGLKIVKLDIDFSKRNEYDSKRYENVLVSWNGRTVDADNDPTR